MSPTRRIIIITLSVLLGTVMSAGLLYSRKGTLGRDEMLSVGTSFIFSLGIVLGISLYLARKKNP